MKTNYKTAMNLVFASVLEIVALRCTSIVSKDRSMNVENNYHLLSFSKH